MTDEAFMNHVYVRDPSMVSRQIGDEHILVPIRQHANDLSDIYALNELAGFVWGLLDGTCSLREILDRIVEHYDVASADAQDDLTALIEQFETMGAVKRVE
jgi:Coenzyme PQQ synthesis protein D (PqqD)